MLEEKKLEKRISLPRMKNVDNLSFRLVLEYIYTGRISARSLTIKTLFEILKISEQLELIYLKKK